MSKNDIETNYTKTDAEINSGRSAETEFATEFSKNLVVQTDDTTTPAFTFRAIFLGIIWAIFLATGNTIASFRNNDFVIPTNLASILSYPMGVFLANIIPVGIMNPGPFSVKEHVLIYVIAGSAGGKPYGINNVIGQKLFFNDDRVDVWNGLAWVLVTQLVGYGVAGLLRLFLVKPTAMLWPEALANVAFFNAFHDASSLDREDGKYRNSVSRYTCFCLSFFAMFIWSWFPVYFAPALSTISFLCLISNNRILRFLGSGSRNVGGPGILAITLDWTKINFLKSAYFPWYSSVNFLIGGIFWGWIIGPIWHYQKAWGLPDLQPTMNYGGGLINNASDWKNQTITYDALAPYNSVGLYDINGYSLKVAQGSKWPALLDSKNNLNLEAFQTAGSKVFLTVGFSLSYFTSFISLGAIFSQGAIKQAESDQDNLDPHCKLMKNYQDIPEYQYWFVNIPPFSWNGSFQLSRWTTILCVFVGCLFTIPVGIIQAITGYQPGLNILTQIMAGLMLPGKTVSVMAFKYMHIPPLAMVTCQLIGTLIGAILNTVVAIAISNSSLLNSPGFSGNNYFTFANAGGIWGAIGPARFFGPASPYWVLNLGYMIGFILPFIPWVANKFLPSKYWRQINFVLLAAAFTSMKTGSDMIYIVAPTISAFFFQFYLYRYKREFWDKYAWVMANAFDAAAALVAIVPSVLSILNVPPPMGPLAPLHDAGGNDYYCYGVDWQGKNSSSLN